MLRNRKNRIGIGFAKEQCFQFGMKELWRDSKRRGLSSCRIGQILSQYWREFLPKIGDSYGYGAIGKFK